MIRKIGIVGLGLIGGSLAKAARTFCGVPEIVALNRSRDVLDAALAEGTIDAATQTVDDTFAHCDIVFLCTPVDRLFSYAKQLAPIIGKDCILTDVGSTKLRLWEQMRALAGSVTYIGGHPMTGSERSRYGASRPHLFENAYYLITPGENVPGDAVALLKKFSEQIGAIPVVLSATAHDHAVAAISHLPHVVASGLVNYVKASDDPAATMHLLAAGGFRDLTRIASSDPAMWEAICAENRPEILATLDGLQRVLGDFRQALAQNDAAAIHEYFVSARDYRNSFDTASPGQYAERYDISVDVQDKPGSIAMLAVLFSSHNINIKNMSIVNNREQMAGVLHIAFDSQEQRREALRLLRDFNYTAVSG